ncbi:MAG TPA: sulfotransferase [Gammaproteobacteria bacterium]|nr:sulfotransferase [Xanthomonadales bacterium]MCB1593898.1 sulfotransferase [Xanthomonadales bacterium]HOP21403.1 sulfotransferase [Gammaproteobacteria bacterium]HPI94687.1 sulfotransferase [Gammaproteobacteria bacterium]HPQ86132.1 sulfotransferase [Gammaproteobacteria bacterium]
MSFDNIKQQKLREVQNHAQQRQIIQALRLSKELIEEYPNFDQAWFSRAFLLFQSNDIEGAIEAISKAREINPNDISYAFQEIMMYEALNRTDIAFPLAQKLAGKNLNNSRMYEKIAEILETNEDFEAALKLFRHLSTVEPNKTAWLLKQASVLQNLGNIDEAIRLTENVLKIEPYNPDGLYLQSQYKKYSKSNNHLEVLNAASLKRRFSIQEKAKIFFALAKELEDCQQYDESFEARHKGADLFRSCFNYDVQSDIDFMRQIQVEYSQEFVQQKSSQNMTDRPIFIVGLPRSGTTLLDRIITSHSDVKAAGELKQLNKCVQHGLQNIKTNSKVTRTEMVVASKQLDFEQLGQDYIQTSAPIAGNKPRFTDKFPQNSYFVGMILKALPNAKIIIMQRHPISVCYAVFKQLFSNDSYPFSYNLEEMAKYYNQHNQLLRHWQKIGGNSVKTVCYEDLVNDLETQARDVLEFLNLSWQPQCLDFHKNKQPTATASASQVREKLYNSSVDLWRHYEKHLQPLIKHLDLTDN